MLSQQSISGWGTAGQEKARWWEVSIDISYLTCNSAWKCVRHTGTQGSALDISGPQNTPTLPKPLWEIDGWNGSNTVQINLEHSLTICKISWMIIGHIWGLWGNILFTAPLTIEGFITDSQNQPPLALYLRYINLCSINNIDHLLSRHLSERLTPNCQLSGPYQNPIWENIYLR